MLTKQSLFAISEEQRDNHLRRKYIKREMKIPVSSNRIVIISGVRRCGKSTLIQQIFQENGLSSLYINFEDPRLVDFELSDFPRLLELLEENERTHLLMDEVQNIPKWEQFARMANDKGVPLYITGSNSSMLSKELGTKLTGRYTQKELFPFGYAEFMDFLSLSPGKESFEKYFEWGGFPEYIDEQFGDYFGTLLRDIVTRDIAIRHNITNTQQLVRLAVYLMSNIGKEFSYTNVAKVLEVKSVRTVIDHCDYLQESYLVDYISMYSTSIKKQIKNPKKVYAIDPAFAKANSLSFSKDLGRRLENFVYLHLRKQFKTIHYYRSATGECDFIVKENEEIVLAVQVCWEVTNDNMPRELKGIQQAMLETGASTGLIITFDQEDNLDGIPLLPVWKWLQKPIALKN